MKKALLVYNPNSGQSKIILEHLDEITKKLLQNNITLTLYSLNKKYNHLITIMKESGFDILILSGGDGTLSSILTNLYNENIEFPEIAIFPTGTCNDFARCLNLGSDLKNWLNNVIHGTPKHIDFGLVNNKLIFLSSYAGGLFTKVAYNTDKNMKKNIGKLAYLINGINELINIKKINLNMVLDDDTIISENAILYVILNGGGAGGFDGIDTTADMTDGLMNIIIIKEPKSAIDLSVLFIDLMNKNFINNNFVHTLTAKKCKIEKISDDINVTFDGEEGTNEDVSIEFINNKLKILIAENKKPRIKAK